ncbi:hypothetical protein NX059_007001 [Plenodomus lindquistii]|nr:hypothetical protein NX059_007001 [Plenodomus lindquistii]
MVLDRVKIMRVFDFVGVKEAVDEVRDGLEGRKVAVSKVETQDEKKPEETPEETHGKMEDTVEVTEPETTKTLPKRTVVADSEDEDEDEDEDMLFDAQDAPVTAGAAPKPPASDLPSQTPSNQSHNSPSPDTEPPFPTTTATPPPRQIKFLFLNNLTQALNPLLKKDYISAHALATPFLTALSNLTLAHSLHTILLNPTTVPRPASPTRNHGPLPPLQNKQAPPPPQSIFASRTEVPSLLGLLARSVDVQVLVGKMPRGKRDARVFYGEGGAGGGGGGGKRGMEIVGVMEIMGDRWEGRVGDWGTFGEGEEGLRDV